MSTPPPDGTHRPEPWRDPWPPFLDLLDTDPVQAWGEFFAFAWQILKATPPRVLGGLPHEVQEDLIMDLVLYCGRNEMAALRRYENRRRPFASWLQKGARNRALDWIKKNRPDRAQPVPGDLRAPGTDLDEAAGLSKLLPMVGECWESLSERCRLLLKLYSEDRPPRERAVLMGESDNKKISDDTRACLKRLRKAMETSGIVNPFASGAQP